MKNENKSIAHGKAAIALFALGVAMMLVGVIWQLWDQSPTSIFYAVVTVLVGFFLILVSFAINNWKPILTNACA